MLEHLVYSLTEQYPLLFGLLNEYMPRLYEAVMAYYPKGI